MSAFVVLSIAVAVTVVAVTAVVVVRLARVARDSVARIAEHLDRLEPLATELQEEAAVTQAELEALRERTTRLAADEKGTRQAP